MQRARASSSSYYITRILRLVCVSIAGACCLANCAKSRQFTPALLHLRRKSFANSKTVLCDELVKEEPSIRNALSAVRPTRSAHRLNCVLNFVFPLSTFARSVFGIMRDVLQRDYFCCLCIKLGCLKDVRREKNTHGLQHILFSLQPIKLLCLESIIIF
jgi:hypothetical protein